MNRIVTLSFLLSLLFFTSSCDLFKGEEGELVSEDLVVGDGDAGRINVSWKIHFKAYLEDGTVFETTYGDIPYSFVNNGTIGPKGLSEGIQGMRVGGKRKLTIPPSLAYGKEGLYDLEGNQIVPKNATVIFEIEFLSMPELEVYDIEVGSGAVVESEDALSLSYQAYFEDNTLFDQRTTYVFVLNVPSYELDGPQRVEGWHLGFQGMRYGGKRRIEVPPHLGFGSVGLYDYEFNRYKIPPHAPLIFEVQLSATSQ